MAASRSEWRRGDSSAYVNSRPLVWYWWMLRSLVFFSSTFYDEIIMVIRMAIVLIGFVRDAFQLLQKFHGMELIGRINDDKRDA